MKFLVAALALCALATSSSALQDTTLQAGDCAKALPENPTELVRKAFDSAIRLGKRAVREIENKQKEEDGLGEDEPGQEAKEKIEEKASKKGGLKIIMDSMEGGAKDLLGAGIKVIKKRLKRGLKPSVKAFIKCKGGKRKKGVKKFLKNLFDTLDKLVKDANGEDEQKEEESEGEGAMVVVIEKLEQIKEKALETITAFLEKKFADIFSENDLGPVKIPKEIPLPPVELPDIILPPVEPVLA